jgi:predicted MFS family arabinose efflux permease
MPPEGPRDGGSGGAGPAVGRELLALVAGQTLLHACMTGLRMAAPLMALRAGHSAAAVGALMALFALTQVFLSLPAGRFADRHGLRRPVGLAVLAASAAAAAAAAWPVFPVLCASALLSGGAAGVAAIALQRHVGRLAQGPAQLRQVFSWLAIGPAVSNFIGPLLAGVLIDLAGFRTAFAAMVLLPLLAWACVRQAGELPPPPAPASETPTTAWSLLRQAPFRRLMLVNWLLSSSWDVHTFVVPVLGHERGLSASAIGGLLATFAIAAAAVRVALPLLAARAREAAVVFGAMVSTAVLLAAYPLLSHPLAMGACSALLGVALGVVQPMIMSTLHQITPGHRHGEALGLRLMVINASSVLMPVLFGVAGTAIGVAGVFWAASALVGGGCRLALRLQPAPAQSS